MSYFTREQEATAVDLILKECNFCDHDNNGRLTSMAYVERNKDGYVVALVDLGLHKVNKWNDTDEENSSSSDNDSSSPVPNRHWTMPHAIGYLTHLKKLTVYHCKGIPREIVHLADSLEEIAFHFCDELDFEKDLAPEFQNLQKLADFRIHGRTAPPASGSKRILPIPTLRNLSNLRYLYYRGPMVVEYEEEDESSSSSSNSSVQQQQQQARDEANFHIIQDLLHPEVRFRNSLEILEIERGNLAGVTVADLVTEVLPYYPKLQRLVLPHNKIISLAPILAEQSSAIPPSVRLKCFNLLGNPVLNASRRGMDNETRERELRPERAILMRLLSLHEEITSLGHGITESALCSTDVLLALDRNDGGAVLLSERFRPMPLSVWPVVLERANHRKGYYDTTNVIYHLLRNGPALGIQKRKTRPENNNNTSAALVPMCLGPSESLPLLPVSLIPPFNATTNFTAVVTPTASQTVMMVMNSNNYNNTRKRKISMP